MNRLHQLRQTLPQNIKDNEGYDDLEFIVLNYNSHDDMEQWIKENMSEHILNGRLKYYKTTEPVSWSPSHAKNIAYKLATGEIICGKAADNFTGKNFAHYVNELFNKNTDIVLTPIDFHRSKPDYQPANDVLGEVCIKKHDFLKIEGFDERMDRYGFEDYDLINRLEMIDVKRLLIEDFTYLQYISHNNNERYALPTDDLRAIYINYHSPSTSEAIFLYKDSRFEKGVLVDNFTKDAANCVYAYTPRKYHFEYSLNEPGWQTGTWINENDHIKFSPDSSKKLIFIKQQKDGQTILIDTDNSSIFYSITDNKLIDTILTFKHFIYTRSIMEANLNGKNAVVNKGVFGKATVYKNFQPQPITV